MIGFVQQKEEKGTLAQHSVTCFYGEKTISNSFLDSAADAPRNALVQNASQVNNTSKVQNGSGVKKQRKWTRGKRENLFLAHKPST